MMQGKLCACGKVHDHSIRLEIGAEHQGPLGEICEDSCLEFFLCPAHFGTMYFA